jgi:hypothetical protein
MKVKSSRCVIAGSLLLFRKVLHEWIRVIETYGKASSWGDVPWWYNERASLSLFAAAIWKSGGIALEEFSTLKGKKKKHWIGRGDLYAKLGRNEYMIEAKQQWSSLSARSVKTKVKLVNSLFDARHAAGHTKSYGAKRLGLVFAIPYLPVREKKDIDERIDSWLRLVKLIEGVSVSWIFPKEARDRFRHKGYLYPGVALLIRPLRQG